MPLDRSGPNVARRPAGKGRRGGPREEEGTAALLHGTSREEEGGCRVPLGPEDPVVSGNDREEVVLPLLSGAQGGGAPG